MWWLYLIKYIACVFAIFSTTLYVSSIVSSIVHSAGGFVPAGVEDHTERDSSFRITHGLIMSICWSIVIIF